MLCTLANVSKRFSFRGPWVIREASAELRAGRTIEFSGPDGAGKSTLLSLIAGSLEPTSGKVIATPEAGTEYRADHLPSGLLLSGLTYLRNMSTASGRTRDDANAHIDRLAAGLGITDLMRLPLPVLAKQAPHSVGLIRALAHPGQLVVLDDPWTPIDDLARAFLAREINDRRAAGSCVIVTDEGERPDSLIIDDKFDLTDGHLTPHAQPAPPTPTTTT